MPALLLVLLLIGIYMLSKRNRRIKHYMDKLSGPPVLPLLGNALQWKRPHDEILSLFTRWVMQYGQTFRLWVGNSAPYMFTCDAHVIEGKHDYNVLGVWLGTGLLTAPASKWSVRRKMLATAFHLMKILNDFIPVFNEQASTFVECLEKDGHVDGHEFDICPYIGKCTLDIICETAMGRKICAQTGTCNLDYMNAVNGLLALIVSKMFNPWRRIPFFYNLTAYATKEKGYLKILKEFSEEVIRARKQEMKLSHSIFSSESRNSRNEMNIFGKQRKAFLDLLLDVADNTDQFNDSDIREEVDTFMFEGYDTTSASLGWTILLLALHPEYQRMVQNELDDIFMDNPTRNVTNGDIYKMKLLECCLKESLRLFPSVPFITRTIGTDLVLYNGTLTPKGATALVSIYNLHRLEEHFAAAEKFLPERWTANCATKRHPYAYIPFSAGQRNCVGQKFAKIEEKVLLAKLFRKYAVETSVKFEDIKTLPHLVVKCKNGVKISLKRRV